MELFTLSKGFLRQDTIDTFHSAIWTERYYGDGEAELVVPATTEMIQKLKEGTFLGMLDSDEIVIVETLNIEDGKLKVKGNSLLQFLNNRFVRATALHEDKHWPVHGVPGWILWAIVYYMCVEGSPYLTGAAPTGIPNPQAMAIKGLGLSAYDTLGPEVDVAVPYGPVYDALKEIASTYEIGMSITLASATDTGYILPFRSYRGLDRTSGQSTNAQVRFSPQMDSLTDIKELRSIEKFKTHVYSFVPSNPEGMATVPGISSYVEGYSGFDMRALMIFCDDITTDLVGTDPNLLNAILNTRAHDALMDNKFTKVVDGEIVPDIQFKYGVHYYLGDVVELQGNSGIVQNARVTEYIRTQDESGERAYPTVTVLD